jgi:hypothetical protein
MKAPLSILFLFALTAAYGQFTKGDKFLSGSVTINGFNGTNGSGAKYRIKNFQISPAVGICNE